MTVVMSGILEDMKVKLRTEQPKEDLFIRVLKIYSDLMASNH